MSFRKMAWRGPAGQTAGLVITSERLERLRIGDFLGNASRLWPNSEARKMSKCLLSPEFPTWDEAFAFSFDEVSR